MDNLGNSSFKERQAFLLQQIVGNVKHIPAAMERLNMTDATKKKEEFH
jgi:hypothetical protein